MGGLRFERPPEAGDLAAFLGRVLQLEESALVRLRSIGHSTTAFVRLPFGVLVSRSARVREAPPDVTVAAAALLAALERAGPDAAVALPARRDADWRSQLPPTGGWQLLDTVPASVVVRLVGAGAEALRSVGAAGGPGVGESLLDQEPLTVSGGGHTAGLPLRVLSAAWRMGFLGGVPLPPPRRPPAGGPDVLGGLSAAARPDAAAEPDGSGGPDAGNAEPQVAVSASGSWVRLAAPYGSAYHRATPSLVLRPGGPAITA
jgi:hypothetical protein